ncbi:MAG: hypothetical protein R2939_13765 [Kofleriaceae bacterium]
MSDGTVVDLVATPGRGLGWIAFCLVAGVLLVWKLATVGQWIGVGLLVIAAIAGAYAVLGYVYPAGRIRIGGDQVELPRARSRPGVVRYPRDQVGAAYLLRHKTPWLKTAPVLIVEAAGRAHAYPRDWFASEVDQRRVLDALAPASSDG